METEDWKYKLAKKRVRKVKGFYRHFGTWLVFCAFFVFLNITTNRHEFWAIWPIAGWGLGVALHALGVFGLPGMNKDWEERLMERELERLENHGHHSNTPGTQQELPPYQGNNPTEDKDDLELKEVRKVWKDSDLV